MAIIEVSEQDFLEEVESHQKGLVLVDFWAPWCGPCKQLASTLEKINLKISAHIKIVKINIEHNPKIADRFNIMSLPTLMIFINGKQVARAVGVQSQEKLLLWLKEVRNKNNLKKPKHKRKP